MDPEKNKKHTLFEDLQVGSNNYLGVGGGPGQSAMQLKPGKVTLMDLVKQAKDWEGEMEKAPNRLPYPLQDGLSDQLGQLYVDCTHIKDKVAEYEKFSIIKDNETAKKVTMKIIKKLATIGSAIQSVVKDIDDLAVPGIGTRTPEDHA